ncbi:hypothetical protein ACFL1M_01425 [Patescibacteria group bacterium]
MNTFPNEKQKAGSKTCGPSCLQNIYTHFNKKTTLKKILKDLSVTVDDPTHVPQLARHVKDIGLDVRIISSCTYNISPDWKSKSEKEIAELLKKWVVHNHKNKWIKDVLYLLFYLQEGGKLEIVDLSTKIIDKELDKGNVVLSCLEESWLWEKRKIYGTTKYDSIKGRPTGHFVIVYDKKGDEYLISDPFPTGLKEKEGLYKVSKDKLLISTVVWGAQILSISNRKVDGQ